MLDYIGLYPIGAQGPIGRNEAISISLDPLYITQALTYKRNLVNEMAVTGLELSAST